MRMKKSADIESGGALLADVDTCGACHLDVAAQWRASAHAFGSFNNPIYRASVERFRSERGNDTSRFCGGCHDIALLVDDKMKDAVAPTDLRAHAGISCRTCHGIEGTRPDGNGSYDLALTQVALPSDGDADSVLRHRQAVALRPLRTADMCATCHKAYLDESTGNAHHLIGQDDASPWSRSAYAGSHAARIDDGVAEANCQGCHMPKEEAPLGDPSAKEGKVSSHRFLGANTWLAKMARNEEQLARQAAFLKRSARVYIAGIRSPRGRAVLGTGSAVPALVAGQEVSLDVVAWNERAGHRFPGGVMDAQDTWLEVRVSDDQGREIAAAGTEHEATGRDPTAHRFAAYVADETGAARLRRETHLFRAPVYNHTILPRDAAVVSYAFSLPASWSHDDGLHVSVRLRHRSRTLDLQRQSCEAFKTRDGRAFGNEGLRRVARALDPCAAQPVMDIDATEDVFVGDAIPPRRAFADVYPYALGMLHVVQERLEEAKFVTSEALHVAESDAERSTLQSVYAEALTLQGRTDEARAWVEPLRRVRGDHPFLDRISGHTYQTNWRWAEAVPYLARAAEGAPRDDTTWSELAVAAGGAGLPRIALEATARGLVNQPRETDLLRVQSLSLDALEHAGVSVRHDQLEQARDAFLERRTPDDAPRIRGRCSATISGCANERLSVHTHAMRRVMR
jgi:hypothetical protein